MVQCHLRTVNTDVTTFLRIKHLSIEYLVYFIFSRNLHLNKLTQELKPMNNNQRSTSVDALEKKILQKYEQNIYIRKYFFVWIFCYNFLILDQTERVGPLGRVPRTLKRNIVWSVRRIQLNFRFQRFQICLEHWLDPINMLQNNIIVSSFCINLVQ